MDLESDDEEKYSEVLHVTNERSSEQNATEQNVTIIMNSMNQSMPKWILEKTFPDQTTAFNEINEEEIWSEDLPRSYTCLEGRNILYRCNRATKGGMRCHVLKSLFFLNNTEEAYLFKTVEKHYHDKSMPAIRKYRSHSSMTINSQIEYPMKQRIQKLIMQLNSPKVMLKRLDSEGFDVYSREIQIRNYIAQVRRRKHIDKWKLEKTFSELSDARIYIKKLKYWNFKFSNRSTIGMNHHYRCNLVPKNGPQCDAKKYIVYNKYTKEVKLYETNCSHTHNDIMREANLDRRNKTKWLLKQLTKRTRNILLAEGFRVLAAVGLTDCLVEPDDRDISFHDKLLMLQQETVSDENLQIKNEPLSDDENYADIPVEVNIHEENDDGNDINVDAQQEFRKPIFGFEWTFQQEFPNEAAALEYLNKDNLWKIDPKRVYDIRGGQARKVHYRCNKVKLNGPQCAAWKCLLYTTFSDVVSLYQKNFEHTHDAIADKLRNNKKSKHHSILQQQHGLSNKFMGQIIKRKRGRPYKNLCNTPLNVKSSVAQVKLNNAYVADTRKNTSNNNNVINRICNNEPLFGKEWTFEIKFPNPLMALEFIEKDNLWKIDRRRVYNIRGGEARKVHYRCNMVKTNGPQCAASKCFLYTSGSNEISIYKKNYEHTHDSIADEFKNIETFIRPPVFTSGNFDHHVSSDNHADSMEFVTGDDSVQYVINYIDDNEGGNENETANMNATSTQKWLCEKMFVTMEEAEKYLKENEWCSFSNTDCGGQRKTYYRCNKVKKSEIQCDARGYLFSCKVTNKIVFYRNLVQHTHDRDDDSIMIITKDKHTKWKLIDTIADKNLVTSYVYKQNVWQYRYASGRNTRIYYYCKTKNCDAEMCIVYTQQFKKDSLVYQSSEHNHPISKPNELPLQFKTAELVPDTFPNSNMIVKEELIINDKLEGSYKDKSDTVESNMNKVNPILVQSKILPDPNPNSNTILKEELIINDELGPSYQNENVSELLPDTRAHSSTILKERVIINDKLLASCQNKNVAIRFDNKNKKKMSVVQKWNFEKKFLNMAEVNRFIKESNGLWKIDSTVPHKLFYHCMYSCECTAQLLFMIEKSSSQVLYFTGDPHTHPDPKPSLPIIDEIVIDDGDVNMTESLTKPAQGRIPDLNNFIFIEKFANFPDALRKLKQENHHWVSVSAIFENGYRQLFSCTKGTCKSRALLLCKHDSNEVSYFNTGDHSHTVNMSEITSVKSTEIINSSKSIESTIEIVISDDSDKDSLNGGGIGNNQNEWVFETKFNDYKTAKHYMKNLNLLSYKSNISKYGVKEYYNCNLDTNDVTYCAASKFLLYEDVTKDVLMYNRNIRHIDNCKNIIPPLVPIQKRLTAIIDLVDSDDSDTDENQNVTVLDNETDSEIIQNHWIHEKSFETVKQALEYIRDQQIWHFDSSITLVDGVQEFYRCNLSLKSDDKCIASKVLYIKNGTNIISLYKTEINHSHSMHIRGVQAHEVFESFSDSTKDQIKKLVLDGNSPQQILNELLFDVSLEKHLRYCISKMRRYNREKIVEPPQMSELQNVRNWLTQLSTEIPDDDDTHYCVNLKIDDIDSTFRCFVSTRRLLQNAMNSNSVNLVSKSQLEQYLITLVGTTDLDQQFHSFGVVIGTCTNENEYAFIFESIKKGVSECHKQIYQPKCLITDDSVDIHKAFIKTFGESNDIIMCSTVVLSNINSQLATTRSITNSVRDQINEDIRKICKLSSKHVFVMAVNLFKKKWMARFGSVLNDFFNYFKTNWIDENPTWFLGYRPFTPHTNKAIDREYDLFKYLYLFRPFETLLIFRNHILTHIEEISRSYTRSDNSSKYFIRKPTIPLDVYEKAIEWNNLEKQIEIVNGSTETRYYVTTGNEKYISEQKLEKYRSCRYETLDELFENQSQFCCVRRLKNQTTLTCSCVDFMETFVCEHSMGIGIVLKINKITPSN